MEIAIDEKTIRAIESDLDNFNIMKNVICRKKGWCADFVSVPTNIYLLLQSSSSDSVIYRATLIKDKNGNVQRGICDTPWLDNEYGKDEVQELFVRDGIKAWYMPETRMDYINEVLKAVALRARPEISCSRKYPDGTVHMCLKNKGTGEREYIEWH